MSVFSVSGLSSGIDFASMTNKIMAYERRPVDLLKAKQDEYQGQLNAWGVVKGKLSELETIANSMKTLSDLSPVSASFTNNNVLDSRNIVSILSTSVTSEQDASLTVNKLALNHRTMSSGVASGGTLSQGTFSVTIGGTTTDFTITLDSTNNTLEKLKTSINGAGLGVTASIINDGSSSNPYHLILTSDAIGAANAITVQHSVTPFTVMGAEVTVGTALSFSDLQAAQDAEVVYGGQTITRTSNTISDLIGSTTIKLQNAGSGTISFAKNDTSLKEKITGFVAKYNETKLLIAKNTSYDMTTFDPQNKQILPLHGDSTLLGLLSTLNGSVADKVSGLTGTYTSLPSIGITTNKNDGTLTIDSAKLDESIATDHKAVSDIFIASGSSSDSTILSFADHTRDTSSGTYTIHYGGKDASGNVQGYFEDSSGNKYDATGTGNFLVGTSGIAKGLTVRVDPSAVSVATTYTDPFSMRVSVTGYDSIGSVTFSVGVAEKISREIYNLNTFDGRFYDKAKNINDSITENAKKIKFQEEILTRREEEYKRRFSNLEGVLGSMQGQSQFMSNALGAMPRSGNRYRF